MSNGRLLPSDFYLDTSVMIAAIFPGTPASKGAAKFCTDISTAGCHVYYSQIARIEAAKAMKKLAAKADRLSPDIRDAFQLDQWATNPLVRERWMVQGIRKLNALLQQFAESIEIPLSQAIWEQSIRVITQNNLESLDSIHIAAARQYGIEDIATTDSHFRRIADPQIWLIQDANDS